ncbi:MAG TPA: DUF3348 domain-containing protein [Ideonella sp.]|uniref:DUF3348 domain-containing protein n=1 Tax=Ideonella sp. TaxID=1929293 RepID=UPI002E345BBB|nr:DUF3348 domain-containing protein [Ideonella sp.]HEX5683450.1 DUF3348 domain-containing protein [Ideonella sp.]
MTRGSQHTGFTGSPLVRLLARLTEVDVSEAKPAFAERLSQWLGWADAISLSAALNAPAAAAAARPASKADASTDEGEFARLRSALVNAVINDSPLALGQRRAGRRAPVQDTTPMEPAADFPPYRSRYFAKQQAMELAIAPLRARLRATLASRSPAMAQLAAVDAVMEQVLGEQERSLLSTVPVLLEKRFESLRQAALATVAPNGPDEAEPTPAGPAAKAPWLEEFGQDMQHVLLVELDLRLQPIEGLLEALRATPRTKA